MKISNSSKLGTFFTICSKNYLAKAIALGNSLASTNPSKDFLIFLVDEILTIEEASTIPFSVVNFQDLEIPQILQKIESLNITELNTSIKPACFIHLFKKYNFEQVTYIDPDCLAYSEFDELDLAHLQGADVVLTPHITKPYTSHSSENETFLKYGAYNLGFMSLRRSEQTDAFLTWFHRTLSNECTIAIDRGLFVDQKWADLIPSFFSSVEVLRHTGYNIAYWNLPQRTLNSARMTADELPIRFIHFSGLEIAEKTISRHANHLKADDYPDFMQLKKSYLEALVESGQSYFSKKRYPYSWHGDTGKNSHAPKDPMVGNFQTYSKGAVRILKTIWRFRATITKKAFQYSWPLIKREGVQALISAPQHLRKLVNELSRIPAASVSVQPAEKGPKAKRVLWVDSVVPKHDLDAGSLTAFNLMRILSESGFDVHFVPTDLLGREPYTADLKNIGVTVHVAPEVLDHKAWVLENVKNFPFVVLTRGPIAHPLIKDIRKKSPSSRIIFNTVDLHFLRELRLAELKGDKSAIRSANRTKKLEVETTQESDVTIVLSEVEKELLESLAPKSQIELIPLVYFEDRSVEKRDKDRSNFEITFIGSFLHQPNVDSVAWFIKEVWPLVLTLVPLAKFNIVGEDPNSELQAIIRDEKNVSWHGWLRDLEMIFERTTITVAPLRFGAGIKGKIGLSMKEGIPVVSTTLAAEGMGLQHNKQILIADRPEDFAKAIAQLADDPKLREELSLNSRSFYLENYSINAVAPKFLELFRGAGNVSAN
jgi:glycosyltransferase involved in cell wall biosynthesis